MSELQKTENYVQDQYSWMNQMNSEGKIMAAMPDYYGIIWEEWELDAKVLSSTQIQYYPEGSKAKIIHYANSTIVNPIEREIIVPHYGENLSFTDIVKTFQGLRFFQALFLTDDGSEELNANFLNMYKSLKLSFKNSEIIIPPISNRGTFPEKKPVYFESLFVGRTSRGVHFHNFILNCDNVDVSGSAYSVDEPTKAQRQLTVPKKPIFKIENPSNLEAKIDTSTNSIIFSDINNSDGTHQYSSLVCFNDRKYTLSAIFNTSDIPDIDKRITQILATETSTENKLKSLNETLHPSYAKLSLYKDGKEVDNIEHFEGGEQ